MNHCEKLRHKLHSENGASLIIALLFFMVCIMVSSVILTASVANMGRIEKRRDEEQTYLAAASAARMLQDDFSDMSVFMATKTRTEYTCSYSQHADSEEPWVCEDMGGSASGSTGAALSGYVNTAALYVLQYNAAPVSKIFTITSDLPELSAIPVNVEMIVSKDYLLSFVLTATSHKGASYTMSLNVAGSVSKSSTEDATTYCTHNERSTTPVLVNGEWVYPMVDNTYPIIITTDIATITWAPGTISKGR